MKRLIQKNRMLIAISGVAATIAVGLVSLGTLGSGLSEALGGIQGAVTLPSGKENTSILVQNVGNANATIAVDYFNPDGSVVNAGEVRTDVPPGGTRTFAQASNPNLPAGYRGVGVASSDQPIVALIVRDLLAAGTSGHHSYSIANAPSVGGSKLALPILLNEYTSDQWNSRITVVNTGSTPACIKVTYYITGGGSGSAVDAPASGSCTGSAAGRELVAGGQLTFARTGANAIPFPSSTNNTQMAALVEVTNASATNQIVASVDIYRSDGNRVLGAYNGLVYSGDGSTTDDAGTDIIVPIAIKHSSGFYTVIGVQNLSGSAANVNIQYIGSAGATPVNTTVTLPSVATAGFNSVFEPNASAIPLDFVGFARVTSTAELAVMVVRGKLSQATDLPNSFNEAIYTAANGVPVDQAGTNWSLPLIFRRYANIDAAHIGYNSWIQVQVADGSTANVTIQVVGDPTSGCPAGPWTLSTTVTGSKVFYMNADSDNGFPSGQAPNCFWGGATVTSDKDVLVLANVSSDSYANSDNEGLYNGFKR